MRYLFLRENVLFMVNIRFHLPKQHWRPDVYVYAIFLFSILYTLSDLGDSSNLIGSLSRTMTLYSPREAVNIKQNKIAVMNWVFCQVSE